MMACHHATDGEGREEFIAWSTSDPEYADHEWVVGMRWDSLHSDRADGVTIATLRKHLQAVGRDIPPADPEEDFEIWAEDAPSADISGRRFHTLEELEALPPPKWLIPGLFTEHSLAAVYGKPEAGKSFLAVDIAMSIASGVPWHGRPVERGGVLYVAAEGAPGLAKRIRAWRLDRAISVGEFEFWLDTGEVNLSAESTAAVTAYVQRIVDELGSLKLIVIDTLNQTSAGADENSAKDMGRYIASMKRLRDETGATVVVVHHSGKEEGRGMRGSTAILAAMDTTVEVSREKGSSEIMVKVQKQKDSEAEPAMRFMLERVVLPGQPDSLGKPPSSLVLKPAVMLDPALDFADRAAESSGVTALACEMGSEAGRVKVVDLARAAVKRLGMSDSSARRLIDGEIPKGRPVAARATWNGRGFWLWRERVSNHPTAAVLVRVEEAK